MNEHFPLAGESAAKTRWAAMAMGSDNDLARWLGILRRRKSTISLVFVLAIALGIFALFALTPLYTAKVSILLDPKRSGVADIGAALNGMPIDVGFVESEVAVISSFTTARRVVDKLDLAHDAEFGPAAESALSRLIRSVRGIFSSPPVTQPDVLNLSPEERGAIDKLMAATSARRNGLTYVVDVFVTARNATKAAEIANAISDAYLVGRLEARYEAAQRSTQWLNERLGGLKSKVQESEVAVADYRARNGLISTQNGTIDKQQLSELNGQLALARAKTAEMKAKLDQSNRIGAQGGKVSNLTDVLASPVISSLKSQEAEVARREADLSARYNPSYPQVVNTRAELADIRRAIASEVQKVVANLRNEFEVAQRREASLEQNIQKLSGAANENDAAAVKLRELEREADSNRQLYESFLGKFKQTKEESTLETSEARIINPATRPNDASFPRRGPVLSISAIIGLFAGIGAAFLLESFARGFQTSEQVETLLGCPTLAFLPSVSESEISTASQGRGVIDQIFSQPFSRFSEGIRSIRTGVTLSNLDHAPKIIMVCSTVPAEGKSTIAASIAISAGLSGTQVLLIDMDLRNPSTSTRFNLKTQSGLVELLSGEASPQEVFFRVEGAPITVLPAGKGTTNPSDVISSQKMSLLLQTMAKKYDFVVIDCPPIMAVSDGLLIANLVDAIVYVVEWNKTSRDAVQSSIRLFDKNTDKISGIALNKVDSAKLKTYTYYSNYYGKQYDGYYGAYGAYGSRDAKQNNPAA